MSSHNCRCPIKPGMSHYDLIEKVVPHNCCAPLFLCPALDKVLREAEVIRDRRAQYNKRLKKQGYTEDQINARPYKGRSSTITHQVEEDHIEF